MDFRVYTYMENYVLVSQLGAGANTAGNSEHAKWQSVFRIQTRRGDYSRVFAVVPAECFKASLKGQAWVSYSFRGPVGHAESTGTLFNLQLHGSQTRPN